MSKSLDFFEVWISGKMNNILACAREIVNKELIEVLYSGDGKETAE